MYKGIQRLQKRIDELEAFDPQCVEDGDDPKLVALETAIKQTLSDVFGHGSSDWQSYISACNLYPNKTSHAYRSLGSTLNGDRSYQRGEWQSKKDVSESVEKGKQSALSLLRQAISGLNERIEYTEGGVQSRPVKFGNKIFIVHGHDEGAREMVARFLEKLGLEAIVLKEQPDQGRTIIEKFEDAAEDVGFAVVLLTPDDLGGLVDLTEQENRARQNVIFELGFFAGKLGRGRVCLLRKGHIEIPSDLFGVIYTDMDSNEGWKTKLVRELKAAKIQFESDRLFA